MKELLALLAFLFFLFLVGLGVTWIVRGNDFFLYKTFAPKNEQVRRETYEQTKSFRQGNIQRLNKLCEEKSTTDDEHKTMINEIINQEFAETNYSDVPVYLRNCLATSRNH